MQLTREHLPTSLHGTVLFLHGLRTSKEFMVFNALYFRFLGFRVIVPDLQSSRDGRHCEH
jgi:hypothetical protein